VAETATRQLPVPLQKHLAGGCTGTIDMPRSTDTRLLISGQPIRTLLFDNVWGNTDVEGHFDSRNAAQQHVEES